MNLLTNPVELQLQMISSSNRLVVWSLKRRSLFPKEQDDVLFCPQPKDVQFIITQMKRWRNKKTFIFEKTIINSALISLKLHKSSSGSFEFFFLNLKHFVKFMQSDDDLNFFFTALVFEVEQTDWALVFDCFLLFHSLIWHLSQQCLNL